MRHRASIKALRNLLFAGLGALALGSCGSERDRPVQVLAIGPVGSTYAEGAQLPLAAKLLRSATAEGLVGFDEQGRVVPALADRWIVTDDGLSYIFRLRDGTWSDGSEITAESARAALDRAIAAQRNTALGLDLAPVVEIRTMAGRVIELRLARQMPDLLQLLAQAELGLRRGNRGAGPMKLLEATRKEGIAVLLPIAPEDRGIALDENWQRRVRRLRLGAVPASVAIDMFNRGDADVVLGGRLEDYPRLDAAGVSRGAIRFDPVVGLFGLAVLHGDGFLARPENREALAMALDREALAGAFNLSGWIATNRVVNPGLVGDDGTIAERWIGRSMDERRALAASRVVAWREVGKEAPKLRIAMPAGPGADMLFGRIAADFQAIGLEARRVAFGADADLRLVDSAASYARAPWFLNQLSCASARALCSSAADRFAERARSEPDPVERANLLSMAEAELTKTNSYLPLGAPIRWSLVAGDVTGIAPNVWNVHPLMPMALRPK
jgi:peptide/nickel transport system substrate-binding protein/oligopeptide transport system substrate-binding protein